MSAERLGIFGGTFAPVHKGHTAAAKAFLESGLIDRLHIIPTYLPPHKSLSFADDPADRLAMLKIAFAPLLQAYPQIKIDPYEIEKATVSYTVETIRHYREQYPSITLLCGTDMFLTIHEWYHAKELLTTCEIAYQARTGGEQDAEALARQAERLEREYGTRCHMLQGTVIEVSSTELRARIARGTDLDAYLDPEVTRYIRSNKLYGAV